MAIKSDREYRNLGSLELKDIEENRMVEGYASTFEAYPLYEADGVTYYERIDPKAFEGADMSDVVFLKDHVGTVLARTKNGLLDLSIDEHGLAVRADLTKTTAGREMIEEIEVGNYTQMSFAFTVGADHYDKETRTRVIDSFKKLYDVSAVAFPANPSTDIGLTARDYFNGVIEAEKAERLERERRELQKKKIKLLMEVCIMTIQEIEARRAEIASEIEVEGADLDALEAEVRALADQEKEIRAQAAEEEEKRAAIAQGLKTVEVFEEVKTEEKREVMTEKEIRESKEYIEAYANYIKTGNDHECRTLLTENVSGDLPVPSFVDGVVKTAWERDEILSRVTKTYFKGNLKVAFELSADDAYWHEEGTTAVTEEALQLGIVTLSPMMVKKWIKISDETVGIGGEDFLRYIYDELTYRITKAIADNIVGCVVALSTADATHVGVGAIAANPALDTVAQLSALLSDEATNPVIIMNRATYADFISAQAEGNFAFDPFMGLPVLFNNYLPAFSLAEENEPYLIVGDLSGAQVNYPEGDDVVIKYDDLSLAEQDLVKVVGRQYAGIGITKDASFAYASKTEAVTT